MSPVRAGVPTYSALGLAFEVLGRHQGSHSGESEDGLHGESWG